MTTTETAAAAVDRYLEELIGAAREILGGNLIGAYAGGSVGIGAYQPGRSDIDVALVTADPLDLPTKSAVVAGLRHEALPHPARGLELVVYWRAVVGSGTPEPGFEVELNSGPGMEFRATYGGNERAAADGLFWYGIDRSILREHGRTLLGPPAAQMFGEVSRSDLRKLLIDSIQWYLAQPAGTGNDPQPGAEDAILSACRALARIRNGYWLAKAPAGLAVAAGGLAPDLIRQAIAARAHGSTAPGAQQTRDFLHSVLDEIVGSPR